MQFVMVGFAHQYKIARMVIIFIIIQMVYAETIWDRSIMFFIYQSMQEFALVVAAADLVVAVFSLVSVSEFCFYHIINPLFNNNNNNNKIINNNIIIKKNLKKI